MKSNAVIVDPQQTNDWIVPRRVMCAFFWVGIILLFTGIILLVTSKHKEEFYQSWGAILLGLGFCLLLICFILCLHAYCVITVSDDEVPNAQRQMQHTTRTLPANLAKQKAPLKQPPNFKIPTSQPGSKESTLDRRRNYHPGRLKTISEHGSPKIGGSRSDIHTSHYGATSVRADHIRTCVTTLASRHPSVTNVTASHDKNVHYTAFPPSVSIAMGNSSPNEDAESGYENSVGSPITDNGSVTFSLSIEDDPEKYALNSKNNSSLSIDGDVDNLSNIDASRVVPLARMRDKGSSNSSHQSQKTQSPEDSPISTSDMYAHDNPEYHESHRSSFPLPLRPDELAFNKQIGNHKVSTNSSTENRECGIRSENEPFSADLDVMHTEHTDASQRPIRRGSAKYAGMSAVDEEVITPEYRTAVHTEHKQDIGRVQETAVYSRPVVSARVTQLPSDRQATLPNGAPPQLTYSRQYPICSVHAYPIRHRKHSPYTPLSVQVDSPSDQNPRDPTNNYGFRPMPAICELQSAHHTREVIGSFDPMSPENLSIPDDRDVIRPFERNPSNMLRLQSSGLMERGLNASATVYLNSDQEFSDSQMSIYDNLNYIRL